MFGFKKKDPVCGMRQEKNTGFEKYGKWFCSENCLKIYETGLKKVDKDKQGCCH